MALFAGKKRVVSPTGRKRRTMSAFLKETGYRFRSNSASNQNPIKSLVGVLDYSDGALIERPNHMFSNCASLEEIPLLDSKDWWTFNGAFEGCKSLKTIPALDTSSAQGFNNAFYNCSSLTKIEKLDISQNKSFHYCFAGCGKLAYANFVGTAPIRELGGAFQDCYILPNDCFPTLDVTNLTELWWAYANCRLLEELKWTGTPPTIKGAVNSAFLNCSKLKEIPEMDLSNATLSDDYSFAYNCSSLTAIHAKNIPFSLNIGWSTLLEREALVEIIGNLKDMTGSTTKTLTLGSTLKAKLTADDIKVATDKNWTVA